MKRRYAAYVRIRRVGIYWKAYYGRTLDQFFSLDDDLEVLAARCRCAFPTDELEMPSAELIAEGLPPNFYDVADALEEWLTANPALNPELLTMVRAAQVAEREF